MHNRAENWQNLFGSPVDLCYVFGHYFVISLSFKTKKKNLITLNLANHIFTTHVNCQAIVKFTQSLLPLGHIIMLSAPELQWHRFYLIQSVWFDPNSPIVPRNHWASETELRTVWEDETTLIP